MSQPPLDPPEGCDLHPEERANICPKCYDDFWDSMVDADDDRG